MFCNRTSPGSTVLLVAAVLAPGAWSAVLLGHPPSLVAAEPSDAIPPPAPAFQGVIGRTIKEAKPAFPQRIQAPKDAPNVVIIMTDDTGFGHASTFGGPIPTPTLDRLAKNGLRYNRFHTTALCSPTRAALLTGRNHHSAGTGMVTEFATGFPGYAGILPPSTALVSQVLKAHGYSTAAFGKWHNTPPWEAGPTGPFDRWPTNLGFEYFYGFMGGDTNQWSPGLIENTRRIQPPADPGYHLMTDMTNRAIDWIRTQKTTEPGKPFFVYFAPGATHAPHHAPKSWIERFKGQFDQGWDKVRDETFARQKQLGVVPVGTILTPRPKSIPAWGGLSTDDQRLYARMQEVFAGFLAYTDDEIGRLIDSIGRLGELENTLVLYIVGDNGASPEGGIPGTDNEAKRFNGVADTADANRKLLDQLGGPMAYNNYPVGWAHAGSTPFQWTKQIASHFGGTRNPLVISWPKRIKDAGGLRTRFHHVNDIAPTIYEAVGIRPPTHVDGIEQKPIEGVSMVYTFDDAQAAGRHRTQYFEMLGSRAIYQDGWVAAAFHGRIPWSMFPSNLDIDNEPWELYNIEDDFSEGRDVAAAHPDKLRALQALFWVEAAKHQVLPIDDRTAGRMLGNPQPEVAPGRLTATFYPGIILPEACAPNTKNRSSSIMAAIDVPKAGAEGVLVAEGGRFGGYSLYIKNGKLALHYNFLNTARYTITSDADVPIGKSTVRYDFTAAGNARGGGGTARLFINDRQVGEGQIARTAPNVLSIDETFNVGMDIATPVSEDYQSPFAFTGTLERVTIELK
ncbi:MAG: arylsulfatase [Planctomycetia bacterium]|nr:arylsulfatase [Planctomycetia bacterium]